MFAQSSDHPRPPDTQTDTQMLSRYLSIKNRCPNNGTKTVWLMSKHTLISKRYKFSVCFVPKIGSTFWKTVMRLLQNENLSEDKFTTGLLNLNKDEIHRVRLPWLSLLRHSEDGFSFPRSSRAVVFTRDPYTRLFSAYIDKIFLPSFWKFIGIAIVQQLRPDPSPESLECGHDVTFEEFLRYVINVEETGHVTASICDDHWAPVTSLCDVCRMKYDYIGKQESFLNDTNYIFQQLGLDKLMLSSLQPASSVRNSINTTVWSFGWFIQNSSCVADEEALHRVWYSLQTQGYMMVDTEAPWLSLDLKTANMADIVEAFLSSYDKNKPTSEQTKQQRHQVLVDAYSLVPLSVKRGIQNAFRYDFDLFDYDKEPTELFNNG
ncbi:carbohydrate sulfotransferase 11-like [Liolophura sinensis]|uniref:carbohydrate sulfotransferase 11-like n=1 Tax=Liolophura sinensis TaxID=3198878 RepID=UPI0031581DB6